MANNISTARRTGSQSSTRTAKNSSRNRQNRKRTNKSRSSESGNRKSTAYETYESYDSRSRSREGSRDRRRTSGASSSGRSRGGSGVHHLFSWGKGGYDYSLLATVLLLTAFGLVILYSTSSYRASVTKVSAYNDMFYFSKQALISVFCFIMILIFSRVDYHILKTLAAPFYGLSLFLLVITKSPLGMNVNGATRWIKIGPISFQSSEFAKLAIIIFVPVIIIKIGDKIRNKYSIGAILLSGSTAAFCTYLFTDNLSTAIIIMGITMVMLVVRHPEGAKIAVIGAGGVFVLAVVAVLVAVFGGNRFSWRLGRISVWLNPDSPQNLNRGGYQVMQALYAIGSGGFFGKGLGNGTQKLAALPEAHNDMIFSIICEELGLFGAIMVLLMFAYMLLHLYRIARNAPDLYGSLIATGIFAHIAIQVVLNVAVVSGAIPTTGVTLPFISYGGTSVLFLMAEMALALSISNQSKPGNR